MNLCADFLSAGKDLQALRQQRQSLKEDVPLDIDLLYGGSESKSKGKKRNEKSKGISVPKKAKKSVPQKAKKSRCDDECEVVSVDQSSDEDEVENKLAATLLEKAKTEQRNINRYYREQGQKKLEDSFQLDVELTEYLAAHNSSSCSNVELDQPNVEIDDTDLPITVLVRWKFGMDKDKYTIKKYQTFEKIFRIYAEKENVPLEKIHMELVGSEEEEYQTIKPTFTPDDLNIHGFALLEGCLMDIKSKKKDNDSEDDDDFIDDDKIELKMQLKGRRDRLTVRMGLQETFKLAMLKLAEQISQPVEKLRFHFDGEVVLNTQTPEDLDLEGGEVFDVEIL